MPAQRKRIQRSFSMLIGMEISAAAILLVATPNESASLQDGNGRRCEMGTSAGSAWLTAVILAKTLLGMQTVVDLA